LIFGENFQDDLKAECFLSIFDETKLEQTKKATFFQIILFNETVDNSFNNYAQSILTTEIILSSCLISIVHNQVFIES
jgi:hypothetical protein